MRIFKVDKNICLLGADSSESLETLLVWIGVLAFTMLETDSSDKLLSTSKLIKLLSTFHMLWKQLDVMKVATFVYIKIITTKKKKKRNFDAYIFNVEN